MPLWGKFAVDVIEPSSAEDNVSLWFMILW